RKISPKFSHYQVVSKWRTRITPRLLKSAGQIRHSDVRWDPAHFARSWQSARHPLRTMMYMAARQQLNVRLTEDEAAFLDNWPTRSAAVHRLLADAMEAEG